MSGIFASEGGWQDFTLKGGEWAVLWLSAAAALLALCVGFFLVKKVMAESEGSPKMIEIATAIQEGAWAYLKRQFKTIGVILVPLVVIVFITSTEILKPGGTFIAKVWQGGTESGLLAQLKRDYASVKHAKPPASRPQSAEVYVVATGFRGGK